MSLDISLTVTPAVPKRETVFDANMTHNVTPMWREAGVYDALYMSEGKTAADVLPALRLGFKDMQDNPGKYEAMNPTNGWGSYEGALTFLSALLGKFEANPTGIIGVCK